MSTELVEREAGLARREVMPSEMAAMIERLATNPDVDVTKLDALIRLNERVMDRAAEAEFNAAFVLMQAELGTIPELSKTDKTTYAAREDIVDVARPVLGRHGFGLSFQTQWPGAKTVKVVGILTHAAGHSRQTEFIAEADQTGSKNAIQALGSTVEYGRRYTTVDLLNIVTRKADDDGNRAARTEKPAPPAGYDDWLADMVAAADEGYKAFSDAWNKSAKDRRDYINKHDKQAINSLRAKAQKDRQ